MFLKKWKLWRKERRWNKQGRKEAFTWVYRYLRLHSELLADPVYQRMFDYHRETLIAYYKRDIKNKNIEGEKWGELVDMLTDMFNRTSPARVDKYKPLVEDLYSVWSNTPQLSNSIRI